MEDGLGGDLRKNIVFVKKDALEFKNMRGEAGKSACNEPASGAGARILEERPCMPGYLESQREMRGYSYFEEVGHDLQAEKISAFSISINAEMIAVVDHLLAAYMGPEIVVYRWDDALCFRKTWTLKRSLLQFLAETGNISRGGALVLMKILLFLVKNGISRCDMVLERTMVDLDVGKILDMWIAGGELHCAYRNLVTCVYDTKLVLLRRYLSEDRDVSALPGKIVHGDVEVSVHDSHIVIDRKRSFVEKISLGRIKQLVPVMSSLFVLTDEGIKVLRFSESECVT